MKKHINISQFLFWTGIVMLISSLIYALDGGGELWFSRYFLAMICFGLSGILDLLKDIYNKI